MLSHCGKEFFSDVLCQQYTNKLVILQKKSIKLQCNSLYCATGNMLSSYRILNCNLCSTMYIGNLLPYSFISVWRTKGTVSRDFLTPFWIKKKLYLSSI